MDILYKKLRQTAIRMGFVQEASDLASIAYEIHLKNPLKKASYRHAIIDAIRRDGWGTRGREQRDPLHLRVSSDLLEELLGDCTKDGESQIISNENFERHISDLKREDRALCVLRYTWGFTHNEIAHCFGISRAAVEQRFAVIHYSIKASTRR